MKKTIEILEFNKIIDKLKDFCYTDKAKEKFEGLVPYLSESELLARLNETSEARIIIEKIGMPPSVSAKDVDRLLVMVDGGEMLSSIELEYIAKVLDSTKRLKEFLNRCKNLKVSIGYYSDELEILDDINKEIKASIQDGYILDNASSTLKNIRRIIVNQEERIKTKAEQILGTNKECYSESFISNRNGHICVPVKKEYKSRIKGSVIDKSQTGSTLFIEPEVIAKLNEEMQKQKIEEDSEERRILYTLSSALSGVIGVFSKNMKIIVELDFIFAKGKLSKEQSAKEPVINTDRFINIKKARHPLLEKDKCVPLDFNIGNDIKGIVITGPNTGGKTVAIKTVGLFSIMAQSGLHVPCEEANICMNAKVLCDIGDGQNITENLSTFSSHIKNILNILKEVNKESLVILDELGSGTDPQEGMGIAIAILEELKNSGCLFIATTHYPEVKNYANKEIEIQNARMAFDKETLKPLYKMEIGQAGESCALYIADKLGMPSNMIKRAAREAYGNDEDFEFLNNDEENKIKIKNIASIKKKVEYKEASNLDTIFEMGDSVIVYPDKKIGIVCKGINDKGEVLVQVKKEKVLINHKRLKISNKADMLYPDNYDFSIIFDSVANRKARHQMGKKHRPDLKIESEE